MDRIKQIKLNVGEELYHRATPYIRDILNREKNIFLIGREIGDQTSLRAKLYKELKNDIQISFPEHLFDEQMFIKNHNLLSLENLLAESVDAIVLCVESVGSFTELGAFSNHQKLNDKLLVYIDEQYQRKNSFVNLGPVKYLKAKTTSKVTYINFSGKIASRDITKLKKNINELKKNSNSKISYDLSNLFFCDKYLLALLYVLGEVDRKTIIEIIKNIQRKSNEEEKEKQIATIDASLHTLMRDKRIKFKDNYYVLDTKGRNQLYGEYHFSFIKEFLDTNSFKMLELKLSKKGYTGYLDSIFG